MIALWRRMSKAVESHIMNMAKQQQQLDATSAVVG